MSDQPQLPTDSPGVALIAGVTGISGTALARHLIDLGWDVYGISRRPSGDVPQVRHIAVDLHDARATSVAVGAIPVTHAFFTTWSRQDTEEANIAVNGTLLRNFLGGIDPQAPLRHVGLVTGLKHYLGPFDVITKGLFAPVTPFRESHGRLDFPNFYYEQEDILFAAAKSRGFTWSVHRPHTLIGWALGNLMNMGVTLALYGAVCRATGRPFVFPGSERQWSALTDVTDTRILAANMHWAATTDSAANQAFNVVNGDVFRWSQLWGVLAEDLGVEPVSWTEDNEPLQIQMAEADAVWAEIVQAHNLRPTELSEIASWWHTDADLSRTYETVTDMSKARRYGFREFQSTDESFLDLFASLRSARIIPSRR